jgi:Ca2+-binding EF-hand superfamily protein
VNEKTMKDAFDLYDINGDGEIEVEEFLEFFNSRAD